MSESKDQLFNQIRPKAPALWHWDSAVNCMRYCSAQYAEILEMSPEQALKHFTSRAKLQQLIHPDDRDRYVTAVESAVPGEGLQIEYRIITLNGTEKHISHIGMTVFNELNREYRRVYHFTRYIGTAKTKSRDREVIAFVSPCRTTG